MNKVYTIAIKVEEKALNSPEGTLLEALSLTKKEIDEVMEIGPKGVEKSRAEGKTGHDSLQHLLSVLDSGELSGNEILFILHTGFMYHYTVKRTLAHQMVSLLAGD